jgi:hypothetical protein
MLTHFGWCTWGESAEAQHATVEKREPASLCWSSPEAPLAVTCACLMDGGGSWKRPLPPSKSWWIQRRAGGRVASWKQGLPLGSWSWAPRSSAGHPPFPTSKDKNSASCWRRLFVLPVDALLSWCLLPPVRRCSSACRCFLHPGDGCRD